MEEQAARELGSQVELQKCWLLYHCCAIAGLQDVAADGSRLNETIVRFKLLIDGTADDSGLRLLYALGLLEHSSYAVLDLAPYSSGEEQDIARSQIVSNIRTGMANGSSAGLSQSSTVTSPVILLTVLMSRK